MADHLRINRYEKEFERRRPQRGSGGTEEIFREDFAEIQKRNIDQIVAEQERNKLTFSPYFDPNLIFRIKVIGKPDEIQFSNFLRQCKIKYISPSPSSSDPESGLSYRISL
ncbi:MAG: hypothetical protein ABFC89_07980, partial [Methanospirillum sp.]